MLHDRSLPGLAAPWCRITIDTQPSGYHTLEVARAEAPGFVTQSQCERYCDLTWDEVLDVLSAILDL